MIIDEILGNKTLRHREFPVTKHRVYLAHAAVSPLPARVTEAIKDCADQTSMLGQVENVHQKIEETRSLAAKLLGATSDEIAFIPSTSAGLSLVAAGLDWKAGDNVIVADGDFPSNIYPWLNLQRRIVQVKFIPRRPDGAVELGDIKAQIDEHTRMVSLSSVHFVTGAAIDLDAIGYFLQQHAILFCVDAIQSLGALPCSVRYVDFLAADAHKWLLGPQGFGLLFVRRERLDQLHPPLVGWKSVRSAKEFPKIQLDFHDSARRYEPGSLNILGLVGLHAALSLILDVGIDAIAKRLTALRTMFVEGLQQKGYSILGTPSHGLPTGITSFKRENEDVAPLYRRLDESGITVSLRDDLSSGKCIRVSPHFYNTEEEIALLLQKI